MTGSRERKSQLIRHPTWVSNRKGAVYDDGFEEWCSVGALGEVPDRASVRITAGARA